MVRIVKLTPKDWKVLRDLRIKATKEVPLAFGSTSTEETARKESEWRQRLADTTYYAAREAGCLLGMVCVALEKKRKIQAHIATILSVYVVPKTRGEGIGRALMEAAITGLRKNSHIVKISLKVAETQKSARRLYASMGFKQVGALKKEGHLNGKYVTVFIMEKFLR